MASSQMLFENMKSPGFTLSVHLMMTSELQQGSEGGFTIYRGRFIHLLYYRLCYPLRDQGQTRRSVFPQFFTEPFLYLGAVLAVRESSDMVAVMISFKS